MIKSIKLATALSRAALLMAALVCLAATLYFAKWCLADAVASQAPDKNIAALMVDLAPRDPQTHYALAVLTEETFLPEDLPKSLAEFEQATALSPNDFRLWLAFGKARERNGDAAGAELALRKTLEFAPHYADVQWTLGNVLLRRGKREEAFDKIRQAAENDNNYRVPAIAAAWQIYDGNLDSIKQNLGDSASVNAALAIFVVEQKRYDEAVEIWNSLPAEAKKHALKADGEALFNKLMAAKKFRAALQIQTSFEELANEEKPAIGAIFNGGFERDLKREKAGAFEWQIADGTQPQIGYDDAQKVGGSRSLVIVFNSSDGKDFRRVSQIVAVEPAKKYVLELFYKAELKTSATLRWEIADEADGKILAATNPISGVADWTQLKTEFTTAADTEAVVVRLVRENCKSIICPITGKVWFDNFSIN
ncbi:MAG: carbohydrate binding domain-containing protein [Pyrinomonadaceae bacterium]